MTVRRIDLHAHSACSDGTDLPAELLRRASQEGVDVLALTDHDTTRGWSDAAAALPAGLSLVRGSELSCRAGPVSVHLLAYLFDPAEPELAGRLAGLREGRVRRAERMVALLVEAGHPVSWQQVRELAQGAVGRPHVARALLLAGLVASLPEAFTPEWIGTGGRYWVPKDDLDAVEAVGLVARAGGVSVFAHPGASRRGAVVGEAVVEELAEAGLAGLEVDHVDHDAATRGRLRDLAGALGLVVTGGSDYHGDNKAVRLGAGLTGEAAFDVLVGRAGGVPVLAA